MFLFFLLKQNRILVLHVWALFPQPRLEAYVLFGFVQLHHLLFCLQYSQHEELVFCYLPHFEKLVSEQPQDKQVKQYLDYAKSKLK